MKFLIDTHALVWFYQTDKKLSTLARALIEDPGNSLIVSPASYWEIAIKIAMQKPILNVPFVKFVKEAILDNGFTILPIEPSHCEMMTTLPFHHKDPFDRLLVAQAKAENMTMISSDAIMDSYGIQRMW